MFTIQLNTSHSHNSVATTKLFNSNPFLFPFSNPVTAFPKICKYIQSLKWGPLFVVGIQTVYFFVQYYLSYRHGWSTYVELFNPAFSFCLTCLFLTLHIIFVLWLTKIKLFSFLLTIYFILLVSLSAVKTNQSHKIFT